MLASAAYGRTTVEAGITLQPSAAPTGVGAQLPMKRQPVKKKPVKKPATDPRVRILRDAGGLRSFVSRLHPGEIGKLAPGVYGTGTTLNFNQAGTSTQPLRLTSLDPAHPAKIEARVVFKQGANFWVLDHLVLDATGGDVSAASVAVAADHITLRHNDITNHNGSICINTLGDPQWGIAHDTLIDANRIHDCGVRPVTSPTSRGYFSHGVYAAGYTAVVTNNWIYGNSGRGVQLRGSRGAIVIHNVIDRNGAGVSFGDLNASSNLVSHNIITNSANAGRVNSFGIFSWWGGSQVGTGNEAHDNCFYGNQSGPVASEAGGFSDSAEKFTDPRFLSGSVGDYRLQPRSPCLDAAPRKVPGP
jgi:hypothetical protein